MLPSISSLWAKSSPLVNLIQHCEDTYQVSLIVWEKFVSPAHKKWLTQKLGLNKEQTQQVLGFLAATHDIGKATPAFQSTQPRLVQALFASGVDCSPPEEKAHHLAHHSTTGLVIMEEFFQENGIPVGFADVCGSHHGWGQSLVEVKGAPRRSGFSRYRGTLLGVSPWWEEARRELLSGFAQRTGFVEAMKGAPEPSQSLLMALTGFVVMCDWLASNPSTFSPSERYSGLSNRLALGEHWDVHYATEWEHFFKKRFSFEPNPTQKAMLHHINHENKPGMWIVEASVGTGKTETAITGAEILAHKHGLTGLAYALPTVATTTAFFKRFLAWFEQGDPNKTPIRLKHSRAQQVLETPGRSGVINDEELSSFFESPKTYPFTPILISTVDHILMASLDAKHQMLRHFALAQKVLVIDEVHSYDAFMQHHLTETLRIAGEYNLPVILLSATLSTDTRNALINSYRQNKGNTGELQTQGEFLPRLTFTPSDDSEVNTWNIGEEIKKDEDLIFEVSLSHTSRVEELALAYAQRGANVLIVRNTVKLANSTSSSFREKGVEHRLLHSRMPLAIRSQKELELSEDFGSRNEKFTRGAIVVGTQVVEQSLDIDFDVLITDLAPLDSLIQRMGRVWRNKGKLVERPLGAPQVHVVSSGSPKEVWQALPYHLWPVKQAYDVLSGRSKIALPSDIPSLIAEAYDTDRNLAEKAGFIAQNKASSRRASISSRGKSERLWGLGAQLRYTDTVRDIEPQMTVCYLKLKGGSLIVPEWADSVVAGREVCSLSRWERSFLDSATFSVPSRLLKGKKFSTLSDYGVSGYQGGWVLFDESLNL